MKWRCVLIRRLLPEYLAGDLTGRRQRRLAAHLEGCAPCRQELAELSDTVRAVQAAPAPDPGPVFWQEFSRELHLKLAQAAQDPKFTKAASPSFWHSKLPYLLSAPALVLLAFWVTTQFTDISKPALHQTQPNQATAPKPAEAPKLATGPGPAVRPASPEITEQFSYAAMGEYGAPPEDELDLSGWDLDSELAGMTEQEKEMFLKKLDQREKNGSWLIRHSSVSWG
jgi:hypothetical protein